MEQIIPSEMVSIRLYRPFSREKKEEVMREVILRAKNQQQLVGIRMNHSYEGGFELPLTNEWRNMDLKNKQYLQYHNARQLRFVENDHMITGLRVKDGINYMTDDELNTLKGYVDAVVEDMLNPDINGGNLDKLYHLKYLKYKIKYLDLLKTIK